MSGQRELKELVRYRRSIIDEQAREVNHLQKVLKGANIKLGSVVSDIDGVTSRKMLEALIKGQDDVSDLAEMAYWKLKSKEEQVKQLDDITEVGERGAQNILAEVGTDMSAFHSVGHLALWAGMCPGNNESDGKKKSGRTRKGN